MTSVLAFEAVKRDRQIVSGNACWSLCTKEFPPLILLMQRFTCTAIGLISYRNPATLRINASMILPYWLRVSIIRISSESIFVCWIMSMMISHTIKGQESFTTSFAAPHPTCSASISILSLPLSTKELNCGCSTFPFPQSPRLARLHGCTIFECGF